MPICIIAVQLFQYNALPWLMLEMPMLSSPSWGRGNICVSVCVVCACACACAYVNNRHLAHVTQYLSSTTTFFAPHGILQWPSPPHIRDPSQTPQSSHHQSNGISFCTFSSNDSSNPLQLPMVLRLEVAIERNGTKFNISNTILKFAMHFACTSASLRVHTHTRFRRKKSLH